MFTLEQVVPWGRSFDQYCGMFALDDADLKRRIVGCADGPASFNAIATRRNGRVVSCDPLYQFRREEIQSRIDAVSDEVLEQTRQHQDAFVWGEIASIEHLKQVRMEAMDTFLADFDAGKQEGRYINAGLPQLPFPDQSFDLALCSHFLFLYSLHFSASFHIEAIQEMCRVAGEVRVFPLLTLDSKPSDHLEPVLAAMRDAGLTAQVEQVPYQFQKNANQMLRIQR